MPSHHSFKFIMAALIFLAGNSFPAFAQSNEKDLNPCESALTPLTVSLVSQEPLPLPEGDPGTLQPVRARIMPVGSVPSFMFVASGDHKLALWTDDNGEKLHVSYLDSLSTDIFSVALEAGEVVQEYHPISNENRVQVQTSRRILNLEFKP